MENAHSGKYTYNWFQERIFISRRQWSRIVKDIRDEHSLFAKKMMDAGASYVSNGRGKKVLWKAHVNGVQKAAQQGGGGCNNLYYPKEKLRNGVCIMLQKLSASDRFAPKKTKVTQWNWSDSDRIRSIIFLNSKN